MTDYEKLLEEAERVHSAFGGGDTDIIARLAAALREVMAENACDACGGTGKPVSGLTCMCGGTGKMSVAAPVLRLAAVQANARAEAALAIIGKIRCVVGKAGTDDDVLDAVRSALADVEAMRAVCDAARDADRAFADEDPPTLATTWSEARRRLLLLRHALRALDARGKGQPR